MKTEIKERWIQKLESGQYDQTEGELRNGLGFCCLGILCEVAVEDGIITRAEDYGYNAPSRNDGEEYVENSVLPRVVAEWAGFGDGIHGNNPVVPFPENPEDSCDSCDCCEDEEEYEPEIMDTELSELNDSHKLTFPQIAALIKENL